MSEKVRVWSPLLVVRVLTDQALLNNARHVTPDGAWPSESVRQKVYSEHAYWMAALVPVIVDVLLDECGRSPEGVTLHPSKFEGEPMQTILSSVAGRAWAFEHEFVRRALYAVTDCLCSSPQLREPFQFTRGDATYRFALQNGPGCFVRVTESL